MVGWYADAGIPVYLLVDPRDGTWTLYTVPREDVELPALGVKISTSGFTQYA